MQIFEMKASPKKKEKVPGIQTSQIGIPFFLVGFFLRPKKTQKVAKCNFATLQLLDFLTFFN